jgi:hypothetical protein
MNWSLFGGQSPRKNRKSNGQRRKNHSKFPSGRRPAFEALEQRHLLAVFTVSNLSDGAVAPAGSLRAAINSANAASGPDVIQFASGVTGTLNLNAAAGEMGITDSLTILGPGSGTVTIDAAGTTSRIFRIDAGDISIKGLKLANGTPAIGNGGAISSTTLGMLSLSDSVITGSQATNGGAIFATSDLVLTNVTIGGTGVGAANTATANGGGIYSQGTTLTLKNSVVTGNSATAGHGGGIFTVNTANLQSSTVSGNTAGNRGGGVDATTLVSLNSTISGNTATTGNGGGADSTTIVLRNSTVSGNTATVGNGGGVRGSVVTVQNSTVANNHAGAISSGGGIYASSNLNVQDSIIANNTALASPDLNKPATTSVRYSLVGESGTIPNSGDFTITGAGSQNASGNFIGNAVALNGITLAQALGTGGGVLANNGGPTQTIDITGSIAVNKGNNALAVSSSLGDQRGLPFARISPFAGTVDMGAFEVQTATAGNNPPVLNTPIPNQSAVTGTAFSLNAGGFFSDPDNDTLTFSAEQVGGLALPSWLSFNTATGTFSGIPTATDIGSIQIKVTATDNKTAPATSPPLPSATFTLNVTAAPVIPPVGAELPFTENFEAPVPAGQIAPDPRIVDKSPVPSFATTTSTPIAGTASLQATRASVGARPVATVDFTNPATAGSVTNVAVTVNPLPGNGTSLWSNAVVVYDFQNANNYKFAGLFQIIHKLIIGEVVNGKVTYRAIKAFTATPPVTLNVAINRATRQVTLSANTTSVAFTHATLGTGTVGVGTINANAKFDNLTIT